MFQVFDWVWHIGQQARTCLQVHGHDMSCLAHIPNSSRYVSGAEEKVLRVFEAPQTFNQTLALAQGRTGPSADTPSGGPQVNSCVYVCVCLHAQV